MGLIFLDKQNLRITKGKPLNYQSTSITQREFCGRCGSPVFFARQTRPKLIGVFVGSLDDLNAFSPQYHLCTSSAVGWLHVDDELPRFGKKPAGMSATIGYNSATGHVTEPE